jgi:uncharacterized protein YcbX
MTRAQAKALERLRTLVWQAGCHDDQPEATSKYEISRWEVDETHGRTLYVSAAVRVKDERTVGHLFPSNFLVAIHTGGAIAQLNAKSTKTNKPLRRVMIRRHDSLSSYTTY